MIVAMKLNTCTVAEPDVVAELSTEIKYERSNILKSIIMYMSKKS